MYPPRNVHSWIVPPVLVVVTICIVALVVHLSPNDIQHSLMLRVVAVTSTVAIILSVPWRIQTYLCDMEEVTVWVHPVGVWMGVITVVVR